MDLSLMAWTLSYWGAHALQVDIAQSLAYTKYSTGRTRREKQKEPSTNLNSLPSGTSNNAIQQNTYQPRTFGPFIARSKQQGLSLIFPVQTSLSV